MSDLFDKNKATQFSHNDQNLDQVHKVAGFLRPEVQAVAAIEAKHAQLGGVPGNPAAEVQAGAGGGFFRRYQHGAIYWHPQVGAFWVYGDIYQKYLALKAEAGFLGYPLTDETGTPDGVGRYNHFQGGSIYWTPKTKANEVHGAIRDRWAQLGWERSYLGYPVGDETDNGPGGRISRFQKGAILWSPQTGVKDVKSVNFD